MQAMHDENHREGWCSRHSIGAGLNGTRRAALQARFVYMLPPTPCTVHHVPRPTEE